MGKLAPLALFSVLALHAQYVPPGGSGGGSTSPGSPPNSVQFNNAGGFGGSSYLSTNETTKVLGLKGNLTFAGTAIPAAPVAALAGAGAGNLPDATVNYVMEWLTPSGHSAPSLNSNDLAVVDHTTNGQVTVTLDTAAPAGVTGKNLYRSVLITSLATSVCQGNAGDALCHWELVNTGGPIAVAAASYTDNVANGSLGSIVSGFDTTAGVIADTFGQVIQRNAEADNFVKSTVFLNPGYDNEGRFRFDTSPVIPITASGSISAGPTWEIGGAPGGIAVQAVGGSVTELHYLAFGTSSVPTTPLIQIDACQYDLNNCGSPGNASGTFIELFGMNSDFHYDQFKFGSIAQEGVSDTSNYLLAMNESGTPLGIVESAMNSVGSEKPNFVARKVAAQTVDLYQSRDSDGTTVLPFHVLASGYAAQNLHTPASSSEACTAGQFSDDASFHYVCVSSGVWKRAVLSSF